MSIYVYKHVYVGSTPPTQVAGLGGKFEGCWLVGSLTFVKISCHHQEFQVPKMEVLNLIRLFWGWGFPYISRIHTAYMTVRMNPPF